MVLAWGVYTRQPNRFVTGILVCTVEVFTQVRDPLLPRSLASRVSWRTDPLLRRRSAVRSARSGPVLVCVVHRLLRGLQRPPHDHPALDIDQVHDTGRPER
jgi:hypothetical protein